MKSRFLILSATLLFMLSGLAFGQSFGGRDKVWSRFTRYVDGKKYSFEVTAEELQNLPSWKPEDEDVPLSSRKAIQIAWKGLQKYIIPDKWILERIELTRMAGDKWIYEIYFDRFIEDDRFPEADSSFMIYVKMDGSIVEPKIEPHDGKIKAY
jgi:hypothetical protein